MTESKEFNPNLRPNGKRRWKPRLGLTNPSERMDELLEEEDRHASEVLTTGQSGKKPRIIVQKDMPLDAADRREEK